ncbi:MAG: hypothetical protein DMG57_18710 [Acidobacteria bacterium]|nr:MAG: hypothetical protein DMG57_18710 [Acidobacteriota bacterium]
MAALAFHGLEHILQNKVFVLTGNLQSKMREFGFMGRFRTTVPFECNLFVRIPKDFPRNRSLPPAS